MKSQLFLLAATAAICRFPGVGVTASRAASDMSAILPGKGLAEHDFFYAGEAKEERMFIVRKGAVAWSYTHPGKGEISDAKDCFNQWSGRVDTNHPPVQAIEVTPAKKVVWALRSWAPPADLGPATTIQVLHEPAGSASPATLPNR